MFSDPDNYEELEGYKEIFGDWDNLSYSKSEILHSMQHYLKRDVSAEFFWRAMYSDILERFFWYESDHIEDLLKAMVYSLMVYTSRLFKTKTLDQITVKELIEWRKNFQCCIDLNNKHSEDPLYLYEIIKDAMDSYLAYMDYSILLKTGESDFPFLGCSLRRNVYQYMEEEESWLKSGPLIDVSNI